MPVCNLKEGLEWWLMVHFVHLVHFSPAEICSLSYILLKFMCERLGRLILQNFTGWLLWRTGMRLHMLLWALRSQAWSHADGACQHVPDDATALIVSLHWTPLHPHTSHVRAVQDWCPGPGPGGNLSGDHLSSHQEPTQMLWECFHVQE